MNSMSSTVCENEYPPGLADASETPKENDQYTLDRLRTSPSSVPLDSSIPVAELSLRHLVDAYAYGVL
jgi:hypothetical protein